MPITRLTVVYLSTHVKSWILILFKTFHAYYFFSREILALNHELGTFMKYFNTDIKYFRSLCAPQYSIKDAQGNVVLMIEGPVCTTTICGSDVEFEVMSPDGQSKVGKISKQWSGFLKEAFTDADIFGINFPIDLDVRMKAVLLGACMLIDFNFFEKTNNKDNDGIGMMD